MERCTVGGVDADGGTGASARRIASVVDVVIAGSDVSDCGPADGSTGRKGDGPTSREGCAAGCVSAESVGGASAARLLDAADCDEGVETSR